MRISEIYRSAQGEGFLTGTESAFVRVSGCNLRCWFCDTPHTSWRPEGDDLGILDIVKRVEAFSTRHVVITGGEPMLFAELIPLSQQLRSVGHHITIETAGTLFHPVLCDLMSLSPKRKNSTPSAQLAGPWHQRHEATRHAPDVMRQLIAQYAYQIKFVIDRREDCEDVEQYLTEFPEIDRSRVFLMPQGQDVESLAAVSAWLEDYCRQADLKHCPRMHIEWYGLVRGT